MKRDLVNYLLSGNLILALPIAALAGLISFASPCVIPLVPGYLTYAAGFSKNRGKLFLGSLLFVMGFTALFVTYGALFGSLGSSIAANSKTITKFLGIFTIIMGLIFMGRIKFMRTFKINKVANSGLLSAPVLGFLFGLGWTPCIGPALAAATSGAPKPAAPPTPPASPMGMPSTPAMPPRPMSMMGSAPAPTLEPGDPVARNTRND